MKKSLMIISAVFLSFATSGQQFDWLVSSGFYAQCHSGACDSSGSVYFVGEFVKEIAFGDTILYASGNKLEIFLVRYDSSGQFIWARSAGGSGDDFCFEVANDHEGYIYITGNFTGQAHFGNYTLTSTGENDIYLAKYDSEGTCLWVDQAGGPDYFDNAIALDIDPAGNIYLTGCFDNTATFGDTTLSSGYPSSGDPNLEWGGDIFIAKYKTTGQLEFAKYLPGTEHANRGHAIVCCSDGSFYLSGKYEGTLEIDTCLLTSAGDYDIFLARFNSSGQVMWVRSAGSESDDKPSPSGIYADDAGVFLTGYFQDTASFSGHQLISSGGWDHFLVNYDTLGNLKWATRDGGPGNDRGYSLSKSNDLLYLTGYFMNEVLFGGLTQLTSAGGKDVFVSIYNDNGVFQWADSHGGQGEDWGFLVLHDIWHGCYLAGFHTNDAVFGDTVLQVNNLQNMYFGRFQDSSCAIYISNHQAAEAFSIFPNPASATITIETPSTGSLFIFDANGQQLFQQEITELKITVDVRGWKNGVYVVKIVGEKAVSVGKFIKQ